MIDGIVVAAIEWDRKCVYKGVTGKWVVGCFGCARGDALHCVSCFKRVGKIGILRQYLRPSGHALLSVSCRSFLAPNSKGDVEWLFHLSK